MKILICYKEGIGEASSRSKIVLIQWLFNAVFAAVTYALFSSVFASALGRSGSATGLMGKADLNVLFEVLTTSGRSLGVLIAGLLALLLAYFLVSIFIHGGILRGLVDLSEQRGGGPVFFAGGAAYYGRFFRLTVYALPFCVVPAVLVFAALSALLNALTRDSTNEPLTFALLIFRAALAVFLVFLIKMAMDYARIRIATGETGQVFRSLIASLRFIARRPVATFGLYYLMGLTGWALFAVWRLLLVALPTTTAGAVWAGFLLTQVFIAGRGWLRIAYQAAQLANLQSPD
jgi:hypothetical protein